MPIRGLTYEEYFDYNRDGSLKTSEQLNIVFFVSDRTDFPSAVPQGSIDIARVIKAVYNEEKKRNIFLVVFYNDEIVECHQFY